MSSPPPDPRKRTIPAEHSHHLRSHHSIFETRRFPETNFQRHRPGWFAHRDAADEVRVAIATPGSAASRLQLPWWCWRYWCWESWKSWYYWRSRCSVTNCVLFYRLCPDNALVYHKVRKGSQKLKASGVMRLWRFTRTEGYPCQESLCVVHASRLLTNTSNLLFLFPRRLFCNQRAPDSRFHLSGGSSQDFILNDTRTTVPHKKFLSTMSNS